MSKSLAELKKQSQAVLTKIKESKSDSYSSNEKSDVWTPTYDKEKGIGYAKVRFLPAPQGEDFPYVSIFSHGFKGPSGKWFIENCPSTIKKKSPVGDMNSRLWNSGIESDKQVARAYKRRQNIFANVLIIEDPMNPENNGTVKMYRYGPMIDKILQEKMFPQFETETPLNPFDPWGGAIFEIRITTKKVGKDTVPNYEKSFFHPPTPMGDDDFIEETWKQCHSLESLRAEDKFKSYDELKSKLFEVLGPTVGSGIATVEGYDEVPTPPKSNPAPSRSAPAPAPAAKDDDNDSPFDVDPSPVSESSGDSDQDFFDNL